MSDQQSAIEQVRALVEAARHGVNIIEQYVDRDALGVVGDDENCYPLLDEYLHNMRQALVHGDTLLAALSAPAACNAAKDMRDGDDWETARCGLPQGHLGSHEGMAHGHRWFWNEHAAGIMRDRHPTTNQPLTHHPLIATRADYDAPAAEPWQEKD